MGPDAPACLIAFLVPALGVLVLVTIAPFAFLLVTSLTPLDLTKPGSLRLEGFENYRELVRDARFWNSVWDRVIIALIAIASGQTGAPDGMKALQKDAEALLRKEGAIKG